MQEKFNTEVNNDAKEEHSTSPARLTDSHDEPEDNVSIETDEKTFPSQYVKKLRKECARYRSALKEIRHIYKDFPQEKLKEHEALKDELIRIKEVHANREKEIEKSREETKAYKIEKRLVKLAASFDAIAPKQVAFLLKGKVDAGDDGQAFVISDNGIQTPSNIPLTIEELVKDFLQNNLHLVRSKSKKKGATSSPHVTSTISFEQVSTMTAGQYKRNRERILKSLSQT